MHEAAYRAVSRKAIRWRLGRPSLCLRPLADHWPTGGSAASQSAHRDARMASMAQGNQVCPVIGSSTRPIHLMMHGSGPISKPRMVAQCRLIGGLAGRIVGQERGASLAPPPIEATPAGLPGSLPVGLFGMGSTAAAIGGHTRASGHTTWTQRLTWHGAPSVGLFVSLYKQAFTVYTEPKWPPSPEPMAPCPFRGPSEGDPLSAPPAPSERRQSGGSVQHPSCGALHVDRTAVWW